MALAPDPSSDNALDALRADVGRALKIIEAKRPEYEKGREFYRGDRKEVGGSDVARAIIEQGKSTPISFAHIPVDVIADKVELASLTAAGAAPAAALTTWWDENDLDDESDDWVRKACYLGDYYAITDPGSEDDEGAASIEDVDTIGVSPLSAVMVYDKKTQREALYGFQSWSVGSDAVPQRRALLYYDDVTVKLITVVGKKGDDPLDYVLDVAIGEEDDLAWLRHEGGRKLLAHLPVGGKPYGVPLHRKAWGFQDAITKISANNLVNVDAQGLPSRWALMDPLAEVDDDLDADFGTNGPGTITATPENDDGMTSATRKRNVKTVPGAISMLRGVKATGTYEAGDSAPFLANLDWYVRGMAVATGVPLFEFDMTGDQPSGESRRRAEARANRTAAKVARSAGAFFRELADTALAVCGMTAEVTASFAPHETASDAEGLELVSAKVKAGVPLRVALLEAGYTDEQVKAWYPDKAPAASPEIVALLAGALAQLGQAKTLGVITDTELAEMLPEILTAARGEGPAAPDLGADALAIEGEILTAEVDPSSTLKAQADALGILVRAGADPEQAAEKVGLGGLTFPNVPTTVRIPESEAANIEAK